MHVRNPFVASLSPRQAGRAAPSLSILFTRLSARFVVRREVAPEPSSDQVKHALENLGSPQVLDSSPLIELRATSRRLSAAELRALLVDVVAELSVSRAPRDAEAGRLLLDYYIKRVGTHDVTMERLHLSRPTYYRRLRRGYVLVAGQLNRLNDFASWFPRLTTVSNAFGPEVFGYRPKSA